MGRAVSFENPEPVIAFVSVQQIVVPFAVQEIVAHLAIEAIGTVASTEDVVAGTSIDPVDSQAAGQSVGPPSPNTFDGIEVITSETGASNRSILVISGEKELLGRWEK